jgi:hypothetical protein
MDASGPWLEPQVFGTVSAFEADATAPRATAWLLAGSGIQFVDFEIPAGLLALTYGRFVEDYDATHGSLLIPLEDRPDYDGVEWHPATGRALSPDETLWLTGFGAVEPYLGVWLPAPCLRVVLDHAGAPRFDIGPGNWARLFIESPVADIRTVTRLKGVLAIDTRIDETPRSAAPAYLAPNLDDVRHGAEYRLASDAVALAPLLSEAWIDRWLAGRFRTWRTAGSTSASVPVAPEGRFALEHIARYIALLRLLDRSHALPCLRFHEVAPASAPRPRRSEVDLVLDLDDGPCAARLAAVRSEVVAGERGRSRAGVPLRLRWLSQPTRIGAPPLDSRVEFDRGGFGDALASRLSGRPDAFFWPSLARIGSEAAALAGRPGASPGTTGLARMRSALLDTRQRAFAWRFPGDGDAVAPGRLVSGPLLAHLSEDGTPITIERGRANGAAPALRPRFSASSLVSMFVAELILHALAAINAPGREGLGAGPRELRRILAVCPAGATPAEREILLRRLADAVDLVWTAYGWPSTGSPITPPRPSVALAAEAGLSAQVLYLVDEAETRFDGNVASVLSSAMTSGLARPGRPLTVATLDVGFAAESLSIVAYRLDETQRLCIDPGPAWSGRRGIAPLLAVIAERIVVPAIEAALAAAGHPRPAQLSRLGLDAEGGPSSHADDGHDVLRRRLAAHLWEPVAIAVLALVAAHLAVGAGRGPIRARLEDLQLVGVDAFAEAARHFDAVAAADGARAFHLAEIQVSVRPREIERMLGDHAGPMLDAVSGLIEANACDVLLLTGGAIRLMSPVRHLLDRLPLAPHRVEDIGRRATAMLARDDAGEALEAVPESLVNAVATVMAGQHPLTIALLPPTDPAAPRLAVLAEETP